MRRARRDFSVDIEVLEGTVIGIAAKGQLVRLSAQMVKRLTMAGNVLDEYLDTLPGLR